MTDGARTSWPGACARSHAIAGVLAWSLCACEPNVSARAVWVDSEAEPGSLRIQIYDRGERRELEILGVDDPLAHVQLGPRGRGVFVRSGTRRGAWLDLADGRRLPLSLPEPIVGEVGVEFASDESALLWREGTRLQVLPLAPGLSLERAEDGSLVPLSREGRPRWWVSASAAPGALSLEPDGKTLALWRWPDGSEPEAQPALRELARVTLDDLPSSSRRHDECGSASGCFAQVALDPQGEVAMFGEFGDAWQIFDARAPEQAGPLELPPGLATIAADSGVGLVRVLDRYRSVWLGSGLMHLWNRESGELDSLPVLGNPPYYSVAVGQGSGALLISTSGPVLRADSDGLRPISLTTTPCAPAGTPVVSPSGGWVAWTCFDDTSEFSLAQGVVVRVSALGLERFVGVPMQALAIDDAGDLLLFSVETILDDTLDGVEAQDVPRNLFVLGSEGVLARVDSLEPAPTPVLIGEVGAFIQAAALR